MPPTQHTWRGSPQEEQSALSLLVEGFKYCEHSHVFKNSFAPQGTLIKHSPHFLHHPDGGLLVYMWSSTKPVDDTEPQVFVCTAALFLFWQSTSNMSDQITCFSMIHFLLGFYWKSCLELPPKKAHFEPEWPLSIRWSSLSVLCRTIHVYIVINSMII